MTAAWALNPGSSLVWRDDEPLVMTSSHLAARWRSRRPVYRCVSLWRLWLADVSALGRGAGQGRDQRDLQHLVPTMLPHTRATRMWNRTLARTPRRGARH